MLKINKKYEIPAYLFPSFEKSFSKIVKMAEKLKIDRPFFKQGEKIKKMISSSGGIDEYCIFIPVEVFGDAPKFAGWNLGATLEKTKTGNIIKSVPNFDTPDEYKFSHKCDHCKTKRTRKHTFLVQHENGEIRQVGRTCIKDFLGHSAPEQIANYWAELSDFFNSNFSDDSDFFTSGKSQREYDIKTILAIGCAAIKKYGWVSRKTQMDSYGEKLATVNDVWSFLQDRNARIETSFDISQEDYNKSNKVVIWVKEQNDVSNYFHNLKTIIENETVSWDNMPILVSAISCYDREQEKLAIEKNNPSNHFGEIKKRYTLNLKIVSRKTWAHEYGTGEIIKFIDENKNGFVWFSSKMFCVEHNNFFECKATIKKHSEYNGVKETILTRVSSNNS